MLKVKVEGYREAFCGGCAVLFAKEPSPCEIINDTNKELVNFYRVAQTEYEALRREVDASLHSRDQRCNVGAVKSLKSGENVLVGQLDRVLNGRLILGLAHSRRKTHDPVMFGKAGELLIKDRIVAVGFGHGALQIIGNDSLRNAAVIIE